MKVEFPSFFSDCTEANFYGVPAASKQLFKEVAYLILLHTAGKESSVNGDARKFYLFETIFGMSYFSTSFVVDMIIAFILS